ncbi:MAG: hypothetical protein LBL59_02165 [Xanthomonadaceae bacterium]|jgi:Lon protease-like protein|nr:hypothetical protein [Xanthomonadaceae bacterium]
MSDSGSDLPLFLSQKVLLPESRLTLRLFELRHLDMPSDCCRCGRGCGTLAGMRFDLASHDTALVALPKSCR